MTLLIFDERKSSGEQLVSLLIQFQTITETPMKQGEKEMRMDDLILELPDVLGKFTIELLPYSFISSFVYNNSSSDLTYFLSKIKEKFSELYSDEKDINVIKFVKVIEHLELAQNQKLYLYIPHAEEIKKIKNQSLEFDNYVRSTEERVKKIKKEIKGITAQFISILGIFAAILLGSFGAIDGFNSLYAVAQEMDLGKLLIISSLGASSVILILFFLVNSIAKLTGRSLASTDDNDASLILRYPVLTISYGVIALIASIGSSLLLSNVTLTFSWYGLWWLLPIFWLIYFGVSVHKKTFIWFPNLSWTYEWIIILYQTQKQKKNQASNGATEEEKNASA